MLQSQIPANYILVKQAFRLLLILVIFGTIVFTVVNYYSFIFAKTVNGKVIGVERVTEPSAVVATGPGVPSAYVYSFAVAIQDSRGEITTGSTEDRQWAVVKSGQCAEAKFFPYPPWNLSKGNTYHDVRLIRLFNCPENLATPVPAAPPAPEPAVPPPPAD